MEDHEQDTNSRPSHNSDAAADHQRTEPVRSRWTPKPEQILILESIFNSGMVNPSKDETVRIRKLLEKFGAVGDANVFYWFQNRRSRSRRRQRQIQASLSSGEQPPQRGGGGGAIQYGGNSGLANYTLMNTASCVVGSGSSSGCGLGGNDGNCDDYFAFSGHTGLQELDQGSVFGTSDGSSLHYQS